LITREPSRTHAKKKRMGERTHLDEGLLEAVRSRNYLGETTVASKVAHHRQRHADCVLKPRTCEGIDPVPSNIKTVQP
jgi:hypothetical protein